MHYIFHLSSQYNRLGSMSKSLWYKYRFHGMMCIEFYHMNYSKDRNKNRLLTNKASNRLCIYQQNHTRNKKSHIDNTTHSVSNIQDSILCNNLELCNICSCLHIVYNYHFLVHNSDNTQCKLH